MAKKASTKQQQAKQFAKLMDTVGHRVQQQVKKQKLNPEQMAQVLAGGQLLSDRVTDFMVEQVIQMAMSPDVLARYLLHDRYITPQQITSSFGPQFEYSAEQLEMLNHALPSLERLQWLADNNWLLIPGPPRPLTLADMKAEAVLLLYRGSSRKQQDNKDWFLQDVQRFAVEETVSCRWLLVPRSLRLNGSKDQELDWQVLAQPQEPHQLFLSAVEVAWVLSAFKIAVGRRLIREQLVATTSQTDDGQTVWIGKFWHFGFHLYAADRGRKQPYAVSLPAQSQAA